LATLPRQRHPPTASHPRPAALLSAGDCHAWLSPTRKLLAASRPVHDRRGTAIPGCPRSPPTGPPLPHPSPLQRASHEASPGSPTKRGVGAVLDRSRVPPFSGVRGVKWQRLASVAKKKALTPFLKMCSSSPVSRNIAPALSKIVITKDCLGSLFPNQF